MSGNLPASKYFMWLQLVGQLASIVANKGGAAPKELMYLNMLTTAARYGTLTEEELTELDKRVTNDIRTGVEPASADLEELENRLLSRSRQIQAKGDMPPGGLDATETVQERVVREQRASQPVEQPSPQNHPDNQPEGGA
jgi:hypothetical protein